ncbi:hypothetical protein BOW53_12745 [Solemya pervernicosa gill symbiont]|uniref:Molecular chaperone n=1 Tax=Solemya pervernicosa gill symbiont TaxID=642797 RepID=A0A1T2L222_9GAMM|nr:hypothetical protein [Solemya pervernicosa gill symbiont]OOZ39163.1 hypothetical protein BOW53_12745 [Solemya pervernicosa gill symbiont]
MSLLLLTTPDQHNYDDPSVDLKERALNRWLNELPLFNYSDTARQIRERLEAFNAQKMPIKQRINLLELYRKPVERLFSAVDIKQLIKQIQQSDEQNEFIDQVGLLFATLADGYKLVVMEGYRNKLVPSKDKLLLLAIFRSMEQITLGLLHTYRYYGPVPPFALLELHQLYYYAEQSGCENTPAIGRRDSSTTANLYKRVMLLTISDPFRLGENELLPLFQAYLELAPLCRIDSAEAAKCQGSFLIDLNGDSPPRGCKEGDVERAEVPRIYDIGPLLDELEQRIENGHEKQAEPMLARLSSQHRGQEQRKLPRESAERYVSLIVGLEGICDYLTSHRESLLSSWRVVNEHNEGNQLSSTTSSGVEIHVGEVIAMPVPDDNPPQLATVRWLKNDGTGHIEIGIAFLDGNATPTHCGYDDEPARASLFLKAQPEIGLPTTMIAAKGIYQKGRQLHLTAVTGQRVKAKAGSSLVQTQRFDQFTLHK